MENGEQIHTTKNQKLKTNKLKTIFTTTNLTASRQQGGLGLVHHHYNITKPFRLGYYYYMQFLEFLF
jgi:hypothetical protein